MSDDASLVRQAQAGDVAGLGELLERHRALLHAVAAGMLGAGPQAEDAVQETFVIALRRIGDLRDPAAAPGWFLRIVTTMCLRNLRRRKLKRALLGWLPGKDEQPEIAVDASSEAIAERMHGSAAPVPAEALVDREKLGALFDRLDELSAQQRAALVLRYGHDLPVATIAEMLGVELATAKTHLVRGLARLRDLMEEHR